MKFKFGDTVNILNQPFYSPTMHFFTVVGYKHLDRLNFYQVVSATPGRQSSVVIDQALAREWFRETDLQLVEN